MCVCVCARARECKLLCVYVCVRARVCARVRACVFLSVCAFVEGLTEAEVDLTVPKALAPR